VVVASLGPPLRRAAEVAVADDHWPPVNSRPTALLVKSGAAGSVSTSGLRSVLPTISNTSRSKAVTSSACSVGAASAGLAAKTVGTPKRLHEPPSRYGAGASAFVPASAVCTATMATSTWSSVGVRVVRRCTAMAGTITGFSQRLTPGRSDTRRIS